MLKECWCRGLVTCLARALRLPVLLVCGGHVGGANTNNSEVWKCSFKGEDSHVCHASQHPRAALQCFAFCCGDLFLEVSFYDFPESDCDLKKFNFSESNSGFLVTHAEVVSSSILLHPQLRQRSIREEIADRQTDSLDDVRFLQTSWRQRSHLGLQRFDKRLIKERQRSDLRHKVGRRVTISFTFSDKFTTPKFEW